MEVKDNYYSVTDEFSQMVVSQPKYVWELLICDGFILQFTEGKVLLTEQQRKAQEETFGFKWTKL